MKDVHAALRADINSVRTTLRKTTAVSGKYLPYDNSTGRYRIDPNLIDVDLWRMLTAIDRANTLADDDAGCLAALQEAVGCYGGDFATGQDRAWVIDHAATYRNHVLSDYGRIAEILELDAPDQAIAALERAVALDPVNEELAQRIMRIHAAPTRYGAPCGTWRAGSRRSVTRKCPRPPDAWPRASWPADRPGHWTIYGVGGPAGRGGRKWPPR